MSLAGMKCLVTGAGGFLGQRIVCQLLEEEDGPAEIRALDKAIGSEALQNFQKVKTTSVLTIMQGDIRDADLVQKAVQGVSLVIHTACIIDILGLVDKQTLWDINVRGTQLLLEICLRDDVQYFIYTSSIEVMGPNSRCEPIHDGDEDTVYESTNSLPYAKTKKEAEKAVLAMDGLPLKDGSTFVTCALRSMYIYGEGSHFLQRHVESAIRNKRVFLRMSVKEALVNPAYVGNVAWAHIQAAQAMKDPAKVHHIRGQFYYISDDTPHVSYSDLNYELARELGFNVEPKLAMPLMVLYWYALLLEIMSFLFRPFVRYVPPVNRQLLTLTNTPFSFSYRKAQRDFGYKPRYKWEEARKRTCQWIATLVPLRETSLKSKAN